MARVQPEEKTYLTNYDIVAVRWDDSEGPSGTWVRYDPDYALELDPSFTVGYLLRQNKKAVVIAPTISPKGRYEPPHRRGQLTIPRSAINQMDVLRSASGAQRRSSH